MTEKIKVDILGSCVVRDTFEMHQELKEKYQVNVFIQNNTPLTLGYDKLSETSGLHFVSEDFKNTANVWFKWFMLNAEEKVFDLLSNEKSEYLLVNLTEMYYSFYEIRNRNKVCRICSQFGISKNNISKRFPDFKLINPVYDLNIESVYFDVDRYCNMLKQLYPENHIIFVENFLAKSYIDFDKKNIGDFSDKLTHGKIEDYLNKVYSRFLSNIPGCNVVSLPDNVLGDSSHKWGQGPQHYIAEAYDYLGKSIDLIIQNLELQDLSTSKVTTKVNELYNKRKLLYNDAKMKFEHIGINMENINPYAKFCNRYATIRIDIKSSNKNKDTLSIIDCEPKPLSIEKPEWFQKWRNVGDGFIIESYAGEINFKVKSTEDCELTIMIKGVYGKTKYNERYDIFIDVTKLSINNSVIFEETHRVCHDKPYLIKKNMLSNTELLLSINWCPSYQ